MFVNEDKMQAYERNLLTVLALAVRDSPYLTVSQKTVIENKLQEIVNVWTSGDFV